MSRYILPLALLAACAAPGQGLRATPQGDGPLIEVDWDAQPLPEIPYPNDLSTIVDLTSPTGLRLNIPTVTDTEFESHTREKINRLYGFGIYSPITVSFEQPLDIGNIAQRHPNDVHLPTTFDDDAVYLINVDPDSVGYGELVHLDLGHGRYPADAFRTDRYFPNDTRVASPSILFDTVNEDLNNNGLLDPGEDTDNDGVLDNRPNIFPFDGDPFEDLLSFYDRESDTLILRPVVPLREETTYAVVLTERLVGEDGTPVRSPWEYVNHTRQTRVLEPVIDALTDVSLTTDDIAFAWTFTTGSPTRDLRDLKQGLYDGAGPYARLNAEYPPAITEAHTLHAIDGLDPYLLPMDRIVGILVALGLAGDPEDPGTQTMVDWFEGYSGNMIGGSFLTPYLLTDTNDGGRWDADEWWKLDPFTGDMSLSTQRLPFTCVTPKEELGFQQPYPVMFYGHGYGSNRLEVLLFSAAMNRFGIAACSFDFPGHGASTDGEELALAATLLSNAGLAEVLVHLFDGRHRDLDNDGSPDSGGDQWVADPFHTRDMVRQAVVDWMQAARSFRSCGTGTMPETTWDADGKPVPTGTERVSCDWDGNGIPDIGGPDTDMFIIGGSLGGINSGVAAAIVPGIQAWSPVVAAGGLVDVGSRTAIGGAVEAFVGRLITPLFLGYPTEGGGLDLVQMTNSVTRMATLPIGSLASIPAGGKVVVTNLENGLVREGLIPADGRFRLAIAADAMSAGRKAIVAGIPETGPEERVAYEVPDNHGLGDQLLVEVFDASGALLQTFDSWPTDVVHEGITLRAGTPLVAANEGNGRIRGSSQARRLAYVASTVIEGGDAIAYAPHYFLDPFDKPQNVLLVPTAGDDQVPINAGIALARAAGLVNWWEVDERYGMTVDQWLIDRQVIRGVEERGPYTDVNGAPALFDADDLDDGTDDYQPPSDAPLRANRPSQALAGGDAVGMSGLRIPYVSPRGTHGFRTPDPTLAFDINTYSLMMIGDYLAKRGLTLEDRPCYEDASCSEFPAPVGGEE